MPVLLYRIDDRLVHGQVVIGWVKVQDVVVGGTLDWKVQGNLRVVCNAGNVVRCKKRDGPVIGAVRFAPCLEV